MKMKTKVVLKCISKKVNVINPLAADVTYT